MVRALILVTTAAFALQMLVFIPFEMRYTVEYAAYANDKLLRGWIWLPVSYMFLHGGLMHLFQNMLGLFFFGPTVERTLGSRQFLRFYFLCGVVGVLANLYRIPFGGPQIAVMGASGATLGVLVAFAMIDPDRQVYIIPFPFPITARAIIMIFIAVNLMMALFGGSGISVATHLGGMATGYVYMKLRPQWAKWQLSRRVRRAKGAGKKPPPEKEAEMRDAVDNIFDMQDRFKDR